jgi:hypothetical protein
MACDTKGCWIVAIARAMETGFGDFGFVGIVKHIELKRRGAKKAH